MSKPNKEKEVAAKIAQDLFQVQDAAGFSEGMDHGAYAMPFIAVLQGLSKQVQRGTPEYIPGAQAGMLFNTVTKELLDTLQVTVVRRTHTLCMWTPRDDGGGFQGEYEATKAELEAYTSLKPDDKNRRFNADGLEVTEHRNFYCQIVRNGNATEPCVLSMARSQLKGARTWNSNISMKCARIGPDSAPVLNSEIWTIGTQLRTKGENQWYIFTIAHASRHTEPLMYQQVREAVAFAKEHQVLLRQLEQIEDPEL